MGYIFSLREPTSCVKMRRNCTTSNNVARQQQQIDAHKQRRSQENELRKQRGEPPLPEEDLNKMFRPLQPPLRLDNMLTTAQIGTYCDHLGEFATQSFGKLFIAESVQKCEG